MLSQQAVPEGSPDVTRALNPTCDYAHSFPMPTAMTLFACRSEDGTVRIWHSNTYRLESTLNYGLERVWALGYIKGSNS